MRMYSTQNSNDGYLPGTEIRHRPAKTRTRLSRSPWFHRRTSRTAVFCWPFQSHPNDRSSRNWRCEIRLCTGRSRTADTLFWSRMASRCRTSIPPPGREHLLPYSFQPRVNWSLQQSVTMTSIFVTRNVVHRVRGPLPLGWLVGWLVFNGTFSTNRLYRPTGVWNVLCRARGTNKHIIKWKKRSERRKHCALAAVRRSLKFSPRRRTPSRGRRMAKI